jgi:hypothetical protein
MRELCDESVQAAQELISGAAHERRSSRQPELEREFRRLCAESERLDEEAKIEDPVACETDVARHLRAIEQQLREVLAERDEWLRESMRGRRRRGEDRPAFERLKDEQERITAELLRCATWVRSNSESDDEPHMRRVLKMLRLSGS